MDFIEALCHQMSRAEKYKFMSAKLGLQSVQTEGKTGLKHG